MKLSVWAGIRLVVHKEITAGLRFRAAWTAMLMFAVTSLACLSLALQGRDPGPVILAALLWILLFFSSFAGADRVFTDEAATGTLEVLKIYGPSQAVLFGKMIYSFGLLFVLACVLVPLYLILLDVTVLDWGLFSAVIFAGLAGIAAAGTLIAALTVGSSVHNGLFSVLMFPVILPVFLPAIGLTQQALTGEGAGLAYLGGIVLYDMILAVAASLLFDYLWYED